MLEDHDRLWSNRRRTDPSQDRSFCLNLTKIFRGTQAAVESGPHRSIRLLMNTRIIFDHLLTSLNIFDRLHSRSTSALLAYISPGQVSLDLVLTIKPRDMSNPKPRSAWDGACNVTLTIASQNSSVRVREASSRYTHNCVTILLRRRTRSFVTGGIEFLVSIRATSHSEPSTHIIA